MNTDNDIDALFDNKYDEITETNSLLQSTMYQQNVMISSPDEAYSNDSSIFAPMCLQMMGAAAAVFYCMDESDDEIHTTRNKRRVYIRLDWEQYWYDSLNDPSFERDIRMKRQSFIKLVNFIRDDVTVTHKEQAQRRGGDVSPEICLYLTIRYLSGGHYLDIVRFIGISVATFYYCLKKTMLAIINCPHLQITFPTSEDECKELAAGFRRISYNNAIVNCVGCVDGYLLGINVPLPQVWHQCPGLLRQ
jgi:hypothetical protein